MSKHTAIYGEHMQFWPTLCVLPQYCFGRLLQCVVENEQCVCIMYVCACVIYMCVYHIHVCVHYVRVCVCHIHVCVYHKGKGYTAISASEGS
jgi:hypothetical protein